MHVHNFVIDLIHTNIQIYVGIIKNNEQIITNDQTDARLLWNGGRETYNKFCTFIQNSKANMLCKFNRS